MPLPSTRWLRDMLSSFHKKDKKKDECATKKTPNKYFVRWLRKSTVGVQEDEDDVCDQECLSNIPERVQVPVTIPIEHLYRAVTYVGGKEIPYTRLQTKHGRQRMIIYERIHEDKPFQP